MLSMLPTPARLPAFSFILDDLGRPSGAALAHALGVPLADVHAWITADAAPRPIILALFWLTRWGRSQLDEHLAEAAKLHARLARSLRDELAASERTLRRLLSLAQFDSANAPIYALGSADQPPNHEPNRAKRNGNNHAPQEPAPGEPALTPILVDRPKLRVRVDRP